MYIFQTKTARDSHRRLPNKVTITKVSIKIIVGNEGENYFGYRPGHREVRGGKTSSRRAWQPRAVIVPDDVPRTDGLSAGVFRVRTNGKHHCRRRKGLVHDDKLSSKIRPRAEVCLKTGRRHRKESRDGTQDCRDGTALRTGRDGNEPTTEEMERERRQDNKGGT